MTESKTSLERCFEAIKAGKTRSQLIDEDTCPECGGELDTGWECNDCGFDCRPEIDNGDES